ncbi:MAG: hypothetical protein M1357_03350 [Candidatus Marsarchaeota archaeon]|nr:hypothetical protein [Candidatus Marsarchaeota archaeon]
MSRRSQGGGYNAAKILKVGIILLVFLVTAVYAYDYTYTHRGNPSFDAEVTINSAGSLCTSQPFPGHVHLVINNHANQGLAVVSALLNGVYIPIGTSLPAGSSVQINVSASQSAPILAGQSLMVILAVNNGESPSIGLTCS